MHCAGTLSCGRVSHVQSVQLVVTSQPSSRFLVDQQHFLEPLYKDCLPDVQTRAVMPYAGSA